MAPAIDLYLCSLQACDGKMAYMLMAVLVVALHQLAPAHAASPAHVPEAAPPVETAPPAALSNSIFQQLAATAASRRAGTAIGIRSGEEAAAPAEDEAALSPRSHRDPCCQLRVCTASCLLHTVQQLVPPTLPVNSLQLVPPAIATAAMQRQGPLLASQEPCYIMRAALLPAFASAGNQSSCCCHLGIL